MKRLNPMHLAGILCISSWLMACGPSPEPESTPPVAETERRTVITGVVEQRWLHDAVEVSAEVAPWAVVTVGAESAGRVVELTVEAGDEVAKGQTLARLDGAQVAARLAQAEAQTAEAKAALAQAERDAERGRQLLTTQDISEGDFDRLQLAQQTAAARLEAALAGVRLARQAANDTVMKAPFTGVVSERHAEIGSWVSPGTPLFRILDPRRLKVRGAVAQRDRARLRVGLEATVRVDALPGAQWAGRIRRLGQEADPRTGTYLVEIEVESSLSAPTTDALRVELLPGMQAVLRLAISSREALVVPRDAVSEQADGQVVFALEGDVVRRLTPRLGEDAGDWVEVLDGLTHGQVVVVAGQHVLRDGDTVVVSSAAAGAESDGSTADAAEARQP